jgi:hypothetical protein
LTPGKAKRRSTLSAQNVSAQAGVESQPQATFYLAHEVYVLQAVRITA